MKEHFTLLSWGKKMVLMNKHLFFQSLDNVKSILKEQPEESQDEIKHVGKTRCGYKDRF